MNNLLRKAWYSATGQSGGFYAFSTGSVNESTEPPRLVTKCHVCATLRKRSVADVPIHGMPMKSHIPSRVATWTVSAAIALLAAAAPAHAQFKPRPLNDPATGELFHIEADASMWNPSANMTISSESFGIQGSTIDLERDLGITDQHFPRSTCSCVRRAATTFVSSTSRSTSRAARGSTATSYSTGSATR